MARSRRRRRRCWSRSFSRVPGSRSWAVSQARAKPSSLSTSPPRQTPFFGHPVKERVGVVIVAGEGAGTIGRRLEIACTAREIKDELPIAWCDFSGNLKRSDDLKAIVGALKASDARFRREHGVQLGAVIIDTVAACFALEDENSNAEASRAISVMKAIADALGVVVLPVHHYGKAASTGLRGASAWRAGADVVLSILADRDETTGHVGNRRLCLAKSRSEEEGGETRFDLKLEPLGLDDDGELFGSCHVVPATHTKVGGSGAILSPKAKPLPHDAKAYLQALGVALSEKGRKVRPFGFEGSEVVAVDREDIRREFYASRPADGENNAQILDARKKAFKRGEDAAISHARAAIRDIDDVQMVWLCGPTMTPKQQRFVGEYLIDLNGTRAAIRAGYSPRTATKIVSELLTKPDISQTIGRAMADRAEKTGVTVERVIEELARIAFADVRDVFAPDGTLKPLDAMTKGAWAAIAGLEVREIRDGEDNPMGRVSKVRLADKLGALDLLGRHFGLFNDKMTLKGDPENPLTLLIRAVQGTSIKPVQTPRDARSSPGSP